VDGAAAWAKASPLWDEAGTRFWPNLQQSHHLSKARMQKREAKPGKCTSMPASPSSKVFG